MAITYRQGNDGRLSVEQMDGNFSYIEDYLQSLTASLASLGNLDVSGLTASIMMLEEDIAGLTASIMMLEEEIAGVTASALFKGDNLFDWSQDGLQDVFTLKNVNVDSSISFSPYVSPGQPSPWIKFTDNGKRGIISYYDGQFGIFSDTNNSLNRIQISGLRTFTQSSDAQASGLSVHELYKTTNGTLKIVGTNDTLPKYKIYTAYLSQTGTSSISFTVLQDDFDIVMENNERIAVGYYQFKLTGLCPFAYNPEKIAIFYTNNIQDLGVPQVYIQKQFPSTDTFTLSSRMLFSEAFVQAGRYDGIINGNLEIRVYN